MASGAKQVLPASYPQAEPSPLPSSRYGSLPVTRNLTFASV